jgi:hypothetical protein
MVEVFKTNVKDPDQAKKILLQIHRSFASYKANFDLDDCDRILRIYTTEEAIELSFLLRFLKTLEIEAEILGD